MGSRRAPGRDAELAVVGRIHGLATGEPADWNATLATVGELLGAEKGLLFSPTADAAETPGAAMNLDPEILGEYAQHWYRYDVWTHRAAERGWVEQDLVLRGEELVPHREFLRSTVYNECLGRNGVGRLMTGVVATSPQTAPFPAMVCAFYRDAGRGAFSHAAAERFRRLLPHLRQALETHARLQEASLRALVAEAALRTAGAACLLLDERDRIVFATADAEAVLAASPELACRGQRLETAGNARPAVDRVLRGAAAGRTASALIGQGSKRLRITGVPLTMPLRDRLDPPKPATLLLFERADGGRVRRAADTITTRHGLTPAERRVLEPLLEGRGPKQIAIELGLSLNTVQTHLKRIFAKTATASQRELLAMALRL